MTAASVDRWAELRDKREIMVSHIRSAVNALINEDKHMAIFYITKVRHHLDDLARAARPDGEDGKR